MRKVFEKNILLGNALSMKRVDEKGNNLDEPIVFTEWKFPWIDKDIVKRKEYRFDVLLTKSEHQPFGIGEAETVGAERAMVNG